MKKSKIKYTLIIWLCCYLSITLVQAQTSLFSYNKHFNKKGDSLNYRLLYPDYDPLRKFPLVIFLHGSGERGNDNEAQLKWGVGNFANDRTMARYPCFVIAPQCPANQGWNNFMAPGKNGSIPFNTAASKPMELLMELIKQFSKTNNVDTNRIYITGLSMGGYGTFDAITRYPNVFAAAVPVCSGGDVTKAASFAHIPIWMFHGAEDITVSVQYSLAMADALNKAGAYPGVTIYPEVGHFSWLAAYSDPLMMDWLFRQRK